MGTVAVVVPIFGINIVGIVVKGVAPTATMFVLGRLTDGCDITHVEYGQEAPLFLEPICISGRHVSDPLPHDVLLQANPGAGPAAAACRALATLGGVLGRARGDDQHDDHVVPVHLVLHGPGGLPARNGRAVKRSAGNGLVRYLNLDDVVVYVRAGCRERKRPFLGIW